MIFSVNEDWSLWQPFFMSVYLSFLQIFVLQNYNRTLTFHNNFICFTTYFSVFLTILTIYTFFIPRIFLEKA